MPERADGPQFDSEDEDRFFAKAFAAIAIVGTVVFLVAMKVAQ